MSKIRTDLIWQHENVLPYVLEELKQKIDRITPIQYMYLYGSRARIPFNQWNELEGRDWDILVICKFPIINTRIWTIELNYYIDLKVTNVEGSEDFFKNIKNRIELYPVNHLYI